MAKMSHREKNIATWVGCRPAHNGEQIYAYHYANNGLVTVYTVPAGKIFFWLDFTIEVDAPAAGQNCALRVYNTVPAVVWVVQEIKMQRIAENWGFHTFGQPVELPAAYTIRIFSSGANISIRAAVHGWIEDA